MGEEGVIHKHLSEIFHNAGRAAEKETVYPAESGGCLPQSKKEEQEDQSSESDPVVMPVVARRKLSCCAETGGGVLCGCLVIG